MHNLYTKGWCEILFDVFTHSVYFGDMTTITAVIGKDVRFNRPVKRSQSVLPHGKKLGVGITGNVVDSGKENDRVDSFDLASMEKELLT